MIQQLVDQINDAPKPLPPGSHDSVIDELHQTMESYKKVILEQDAKKQLAESDKKKLLSLPFYLQKRSEMPEPKYG